MVKEYDLRPVLLLVLLLSGCASERHFTADTLWPFGNPNAPMATSETAQRALGKTVPVTPLVPQAGNVWPGPVQPVPTIADTEAHMSQPLGNAYTPSLPSPYPPGSAPPVDENLQGGPLGNGANPAYAPPGGAASP